jgi:hypothetical protein
LKHSGLRDVLQINNQKYSNTMKKTIFFILAITFTVQAFAKTDSKMKDNSNKLAVLWTSGDPEVAEKMGFMYTYNARLKGFAFLQNIRIFSY